MKVVLQRVNSSSVKVNNEVVGSIDKGLMILVSFTQTDNSNTVDQMIKKILNLRIFDDENGVMNLSILDIKGEILSISQFTLYADTSKGNRPSYIKALNGNDAIKLYEEFNDKLRESDLKIQTGKFGADMEVSLINNGPVTITMEK